MQVACSLRVEAVEFGNLSCLMMLFDSSCQGRRDFCLPAIEMLIRVS